MYAAGVVALSEMVDRLADDHVTACRLAEGLAQIPGLAIDPALIKTNIVYFEVKREDITAQELVTRLDKGGARMLPVGPERMRAVTHYHITPDDIDYVLGVFSKVLK